MAGINLMKVVNAKRYSEPTKHLMKCVYKEVLTVTQSQDQALAFVGLTLANLRNRTSGAFAYTPFHGIKGFLNPEYLGVVIRETYRKSRFTKSKLYPFYIQAGTRFYELVLESTIGLKSNTPGPIILDKLNGEGD